MHLARMIITHTQNARGIRRIYLGGRSSIECWIDPADDQTSWTFHLEKSVTGNILTPEDQKAWALHVLTWLCDTLQVHPSHLKSVPFDAIAALHIDDPFAGRRTPRPRNKSADACYMAAPPGVRPSTNEYGMSSYMAYQRRR